MGRRSAAPTGPAWWRELCDGWRRSLARRGRARTTQRIYLSVLRDFGRWLDHCRVERPQDLVAEVIYSWIDTRVERVGPASRHQAATVLRGALRWAAREGLGVPVGLWERIESVAVPEGEPRPLEPEDRDRLMAYFSGRGRGLEQLRDRALALFLLTTGSRISAVLRLDRDDVRAGAGIVVRQKGGSEHRLLPSALAREWLRQYLAARGRDDEPALWIRVGARGRHRLTIAQTNAIWTRVAERARIPRFTSHVLKHTAVTELGERTESDQAIADHVGWRGTQMMRRYRRIRDVRRQELVDQLDDLVPAMPAPPAASARSRPPRARVLRGKDPR